MKYCNVCGAPLGDNKNFCPECGSKISMTNNMEQQPMNKPTKKKGKRALWIILAIIAVIIIAGYVFYAKMMNYIENSYNDVEGFYYCGSEAKTYNKDDCSVTVWLSYNGDFSFEAKDLIVRGKYIVEPEDKDDTFGKYYLLNMKAESRFVNYELITDEYETQYELAITSDLNEAVLINTQTYNMYYCTRN